MGIFISILLAAVALGFTVVAAIAETAFTYLPHNEAEEAVEAHPDTLGARVLQRTLDGDSEAYTHPLRLTRLIAAAAAVLATMTFLLNLVEVHALAIVLTLVIVALVGYPILHVLARTLGRNRPVSSIRVLARPVHYLSVLLSPATGLLDHLSTRIAPAREAEAPAGVFEEEELREFLERASDAETIEDDEAQMVQSVFEMDDLRIRSLMVPRTDMLTVGRDVPLREALSLFLRSGYSRMPVIGDSSDEILGILYLKDSMRAYILHSEAPEDTPMPTLVEIMRPARFEPETKRALDLLRDMQRESTHVAIVVDEYGGTAGLITLEDLIEELVGDISDEYDHERPEYTLNDDGTFRLSARLGIDARFSVSTWRMRTSTRSAACSPSTWVWYQLLVLRLRLTVFTFARLALRAAATRWICCRPGTSRLVMSRRTLRVPQRLILLRLLTFSPWIPSRPLWLSRMRIRTFREIPQRLNLPPTSTATAKYRT